MANGAAGCGLEYGSTTQGTCPFLSNKDKDGKYTCTKHLQALENQRFTGHPFRCTQCTSTANPKGPNTIYDCWRR